MEIRRVGTATSETVPTALQSLILMFKIGVFLIIAPLPWKYSPHYGIITMIGRSIGSLTPKLGGGGL